MFQQREDPNECINKAMEFLSVIASRFPPSNNQLRTSFNPRNQATIQDGRVTVQQVQGRQNQSYTGIENRGIATTSKGNVAAGQPRVVKCYNYQAEGHMTRQCTQPKRPRNAAWFKEKLMLAEDQEADSDDLSSAKAVLMENLLSCGPEVLSEVPYFNSYSNDMINQDVQEMQYSKQTHVDDFQDNEIHSDTFNAFDKTLRDEITEVQTLCNLMEAAVDQCFVDKNIFEIQIKQIKIDNDQLLNQIMSKEIMHIVANSVDILDVKKSWKNVVNTVVSKPNATIASGMFKLDIETISPRLKNNKDAHEKDHLSSACALGKIKKSSHQPKDEDTNQEKLYLLHMDLCDPMRVERINRKNEDLGKLNAKVDIGIFVRYTPAKKASRIYNKRTQKIMETIHVTFDELTAMASEQFGSRPRLQVMTPATSRLGLVPNIIPQQPCNPPNINDWDSLFQPLFDEYFNPLTIAVFTVPVATAPRAVDIADSHVSTSIDQDAPSLSIPSTQDQEHSLIISKDVKESPKTPLFHDDHLHEFLYEDSTFEGSPSNVRPSHTLFELIGRWTKDNPITNVNGDPSRLAPPSPNYVLGPEYPHSPEFVPEPIYPEFMPTEDDILLAEEQQLPAAASPTTKSSGYIDESDPNEDHEEDPADYPADEEDEDDDEDKLSNDDEDDDINIEGDAEEDESSDDDKDDDIDIEGDEEEDEYLAPADSTVVALLAVDHALSAEETEQFKTDESAATPPPPHPAYRVTTRMAEREEIPEANLSLRKRLCTAHTGTYELGESSAVAVARLREPVRDNLYRFMDTEIAPTIVKGVNQRVTEHSTTFDRETSMIYAMTEEKWDDYALQRARVNRLFWDMRYHAHTARLMEGEARASPDRRFQTTVRTQHEEIRELRAVDRKLQAQFIQALTVLKSYQTQLTAALGGIQILEIARVPPQPEKMAPKRTTIANPTTTTTTTPTSVTDAQLEALIEQGVGRALAAHDADRNTNGDDGCVSGTSARRTE
nr:hypothetical protein [Tanacetum cinerariifolium]